MKKVLALALVVITMLSFAACSKFTCEMCGKEGRGGNEIEYMGQTATVCDDCEDKWDELKDMMN